MENEIIPVREVIQVEVKRREPPQENKESVHYVARPIRHLTATEIMMRMEEYQWNFLLNVMQAMAKPRRQ